MLRRGLLQVHPKIVPAGSRRFRLPGFSCGHNRRLYFTEKNAHLQYRLPEILFKPVLFPSSRARPDTKLFPAAWESGKEDAGKKNRYLLLAGAGSCIFQALRCGLVHAALQNRNFLKQNEYNGKRRFSYSYQGFEPIFAASLILMKFTHFYANLRHLTGNWRKLWRKPANFVQ